MKEKRKNLLITIYLWISSLIFLVPLYWLLVSSLKTDAEITLFPPTLFPKTFAFENFSRVITYLNLGRAFYNSIIISVFATLLIVVFSTMAGYAFAKKKFIGKKTTMTILVATMTIPATVLLLPLYFIISKLGMYDKIIGLIIPFSITIFGIFFMKNYIEDIPDALIEAARIDGLSEFGIFFKIIVPLIKPAVTTLVLIEFVNNWNSFTMPLILLQSPENYTVPLRLGLLVGESVAIPWSQIMAANVISILPIVILFLILQRYFISGLTEGAVKG